jgi:Tfp pilus assembly protein PilX
MSRPRQQRGIALPFVLTLGALLLALVAASFDAVRSRTRAGANLLSRIQAFHAADAIVRLCERQVLPHSRTGAIAMVDRGATLELPQRWRARDAFEGHAREALEPVARWPNAARVPQCLIEQWRVPVPALAVYLITGRGFGASEETQVWLQTLIVVDETGRIVDREWRTIARRPF